MGKIKVPESTKRLMGKWKKQAPLLLRKTKGVKLSSPPRKRSLKRGR